MSYTARDRLTLRMEIEDDDGDVTGGTAANEFGAALVHRGLRIVTELRITGPVRIARQHRDQPRRLYDLWFVEAEVEPS
jgi:hypothetical protein